MLESLDLTLDRAWSALNAATVEANPAGICSPGSIATVKFVETDDGEVVKDADSAQC